MPHTFDRRALQRAGIVASALGLLAFAPRTLAAQMTCDQAKKTLAANNAKRADLFTAAGTIVNCGDLAPGAIVAALRKAAPNSTLDTLVRYDAYSLLDRRLADSIRALAVDPNQSVGRRTLYLQLLARYAAPRVGVDTAAVTKKRFTAIVVQPRADGFAGNQPLTAADRARVRATISTMAAQDPNANLRELARMVYDDLGIYPP